MLIFIYLLSNILANLSVTWFGEWSLLLNGFLFIGLDITARDSLHEKWHNNGLVWKMGLLILSGSLLSYLLNIDSYRIAIASFIGFTCSATIDTIVYAMLDDKSKTIKVNGSNMASALSDSIVFPFIAFGYLNFIICFGQFIVKVLGGFVWERILNLFEKKGN